MSENKIKRNYIITGILFGICALLMLVYLILACADYGEWFDWFLDEEWPQIVTFCGAVLLTLYSCFFRNKKPVGAVLFCLALAFLSISKSRPLPLYHMNMFIFLLICVALMIVKFRKEKTITMLSAVLVIIYTGNYLRLFVSRTIIIIAYGYWVVIATVIIEAVLIYLWWLEGGHRIIDIIKEKRQAKQQFATLETSLQSLKEQFESGSITQEEYDERRTELLSQL